MSQILVNHFALKPTEYQRQNRQPVTLTLTVAELQNLQRFHATRISQQCYEADLGYEVQTKLRQALESVGAPWVSAREAQDAYVRVPKVIGV